MLAAMRKIHLRLSVPAALTVLVLGLTSLTPTAWAQPGEPHEKPGKGTRFYVTGLAGGAWATGTAEGLTIADGAFGSSSKDSSAFGGGALGTILDLGWSDLRLELEGTGGRSFSFITPAASGPYQSQVDVWTLQGNFWFEYSLDRLLPDMPIVRDIAPFAGGGLGLARSSLATTNGVASGRSDNSTLAWQAGGGIAYQPLPWLAFETRYQYADLGGPSVTLYSGAAPQGEMEVDIGTHEVVGGIRLIFSGL